MFTNIENEIQALLKDKIGDDAVIKSFPTDIGEIERIERFDNLNVSYPYVYTNVGLVDEVSRDNTGRFPFDEIQITCSVIISNDTGENITKQRTLGEFWSLKVRSVIQGRMVPIEFEDLSNGNMIPLSGDRPIEGYGFEEVYNVEGLARFDNEFFVRTNIDLDNIPV